MRNNYKLRPFCILLVLLLPRVLLAQLSGIHSVPGTFTSLAAAINSLNTGGTSGPTTINIAAGYTETAVFGGYQLNTNTFPITFRKSGTGANPLLLAYTGGVGTPTNGAVQDGIWRFVGSDNIVIDGIDLQDPNASGTAMMEYGYGFFKASSVNGCQNNTIRNCNISLNNLNQISGSFGPEHGGSKGIYLSSATNTFLTQSANVSTLPGTNSNNKFYSNYIENCHIGISLAGYDNQGYIPGCDRLNDVGGFSSATSNTIVNFGGGPISTYCAGIHTSYQFSLNASFNVVQNNNGGGLNPNGRVVGIEAQYYSQADASINNNTITLSVPLVTNTLVPPNVYGITCFASNTIAFSSYTPNVSINNNVFPSFTMSYNTSWGAYGSLIYHAMNPAFSSISNNLMQNVNLSGDINYSGINCEVSSSCTINSNTLANITTSTTGFITQNGILCNAIQGFLNQNLISNVAHTNPSSGYFVGIMGTSNILFASVTSNTVSNFVAKDCAGISITSSVNQANINVSGNQLFNFSAPLTSSVNCSLNGIYVGSNGANASATVAANTIFSLNILSPSTSSLASVSFIGIRQNNINSVITGNKISSIRLLPQYSTLYGISSFASSYRTSQISNNILTDFECSGPNSNLSAIYNDRYNSTIVFNSIYLDAASTGTGCVSDGIRLYGASNGNGLSQVLNNIVVNTIPATGGTATALYVNASVHYGTQSNRNILYTGLPAANRLIASIGTSNYSMITTFKSAVYPRDIQTFTENPVFTTTVGSMPNVLSLDPTVLTLAESGAIPVNSITVDYAGTPRNTNAPDIGAWEGNYMGFDRVPPLVNASGFTNLPCNNLTNRIFTVSLTEPGGVAVGGLSPRMYYRVNTGSWQSTQGVLSAGTASNGIWSFTLTYSGSLGSTISYYMVAQDLSSFTNFQVLPVAGGIFSSVNNVISTPPQVGSYVLQTYPFISVNSGYLCIGKTFTILPSGASTYTISNGLSTVSPVVSPSVNTSYTITGTSSSGCISTLAAVSSVTVRPYPTITVSNGSVCKYQSSHTITPSGADTYVYIGGGPVVNPIVPTTYTVYGINNGGCASTNTVVCYVAVHDLPEVEALTSKEEICLGDTAVLTAVGALNYTFMPGGAGPAATVAVSPSATTMYTVVGVDNNGCKDVGYVIQVILLCESVDEVSGLDPRVKFYPNPGSGTFYIESDKIHSFNILDARGQLIHTAKTEVGLNKINLDHLATGMYLLEIDKGHGGKNIKFFKE